MLIEGQPITSKISSLSLRSWVIGLGWLGVTLWIFELLSDYFKLELIDTPALRILYHTAQTGFGWLWPAALTLHFRALPIWTPLRYLLMGSAAFLIIPAFGISLLYFCGYWIGHEATWQDERVLYQHMVDTNVRIAAQTRYDGFATSDTQYRTVKLTPVLGLWQFVEPVDTAGFIKTDWRDAKR